jgi:adenosylhomocysteine nucleosidase
VIAVTFALPSESRDFRRLIDGRNHEIAIFHTGVGAAACRERIGGFLDRQRFRFLLSSGFAGALASSLGVGDLVLAENFSDLELLARADELLIAKIGQLKTAETIIESAAERERLAQQNGALAVDMETAWIAEACAARKIPMLSLRVISDSAAAPFPAPPGVLFDLARQKTAPLVLAKYLARHPSGVVRLTRFARQIAAARSSLTSALAVLVRELR